MLVYIRDSDWDRIMCPVAKDEIAEHLRERLDVSVWVGRGRQVAGQEVRQYFRYQLRLKFADHLQERLDVLHGGGLKLLKYPTYRKLLRLEVVN